MKSGGLSNVIALWKQENEEIDNIKKTCNLDEMYSGSSQLHVV